MNEYSDLDFMDVGRILADALEVDTAEFEHLRRRLGIGMRRARYLVKVWQAFGSLDVEREMLLAVGWTKLQFVAHVVNQKNVRAWIIFLMGHSVQEVRRVVDGKLPLEKLHALMFYLPPRRLRDRGRGLGDVRGDPCQRGPHRQGTRPGLRHGASAGREIGSCPLRQIRDRSQTHGSPAQETRNSAGPG